MINENEVQKLVEDTNEEMTGKMLEKFVPKFIVDFGLYELYIKDEDEAMSQLLEKMEGHEEDINSMSILLGW